MQKTIWSCNQCHESGYEENFETYVLLHNVYNGVIEVTICKQCEKSMDEYIRKCVKKKELK